MTAKYPQISSRVRTERKHGDAGEEKTLEVCQFFERTERWMRGEKKGILTFQTPGRPLYPWQCGRWSLKEPRY